MTADPNIFPTFHLLGGNMSRINVSIVLTIVAIVLFLLAWFISIGNDIFDSTNAGAFGFAGLAFFAAAHLSWTR